MIYAVTDALSPEQWDAVVEEEPSARSSSDGLIVVKWRLPTPPELSGLDALSAAEALALMQTPEWQDGSDGE